MKSFSKRVASFTMAAAMVLSLAAVSPVDAEAATAKITKKSSITAGKTYTYNVKNVTKSQYIKVRMSSGVTVKYNNKTVKKNSTKINGGKTIALKVKAADKVANYKATVKAVIYNKKNNKKVKTLTTQSTVKCTELKVTDVTVASNSGKYLVATFNKALTKLSVADIEVRKLNTNELKGVEKVELSSDGKSATITLVGSEYSNATNMFVEPNVEYSFTVAQKGAKASTTFTVDAVKAYVTVTGVTPATKTIKYSAPNWKNTNADENPGQVTLREDVCADDFQELLGKTVTIWYNRNNVATRLTKADETIVYGAFKYVTSNTAIPYFENRATGDKYYIQQPSGDVTATTYIQAAQKAVVVTGNGATVPDADNLVDYAKIVLYSNGNIRTMVYDTEYTDQALVSEVKDTVVYSGTKTAINLKDYLILKDGKTAKVSDIQKDEVVFVDTVKKFADIYTEKKSGDIQAAYTDSFKFMDKVYKFAESTSNYKVQYVDGGIKNLDKDAIASFFKGGPAATVYFDRAGMPVFLSGTKAASAATNTVQLLLTKDAETYNSALSNYVKLTGFNGTTTTSYLVDVADLKKVRTANGTTFEVKADKAVTTNTPGVSASGNTVLTVTGFSVVSGNPTGYLNDVADGLTADAMVNGLAIANAPVATWKRQLLAVSSGSLTSAPSALVELTLNDAGKVIEINFKEGKNPTADFEGGKTVVTRTGEVGSSLQITAGTTVYVSSNNVLTKTTYGAFSSKADKDETLVYTNDGKNVSAVYAEKANASSITLSKVAVESVKRDATNKDKLVELTVVNGTEKKTYTKFSVNAIDNTTVAAGEVVTIGVASDGETIASISPNDTLYTVTVTTNAVNKVNVNEKKFTINDGTVYTMASEKTTVVLMETDATGNVKLTAGDLNMLSTLGAGNEIKFAYQDGNTNYVQVIVITKKSN